MFSKRLKEKFQSKSILMGAHINMVNNKSKYKFDFGNNFKRFLSYSVEIFENIGVIALSWFALISLFVVANDILSNQFIVKIIANVLAILFVIFDLSVIVLIFLPKSVVLDDDKIIVYRFCFPLQIYFWDIRFLNDRIPYSKIISCKKLEGNIAFGDPVVFFSANKDSLVEIMTKHKIYLLPIKDCTKFVEEVNARISDNPDNAKHSGIQ